MTEYIIDMTNVPMNRRSAEVDSALRGTLVRCRNCENARITYTAKGALKTASCSWHGRCISPDGYCAWGVRKEDGNEQNTSN